MFLSSFSPPWLRQKRTFSLDSSKRFSLPKFREKAMNLSAVKEQKIHDISSLKKIIISTNGGDENNGSEEESTISEDVKVSKRFDINGKISDSVIHGDEKVNNLTPPPPSDGDGDRKPNGVVSGTVQPHSQLPKPVRPKTFSFSSSDDDMEKSPENFNMPAIGNFIRQKSQSLSEAITKRLSSFNDDDKNDVVKEKVTEINLSGLKVIVNYNNEEGKELLGRVSFFSRSNCRDCTAVRSFLREKKLNYIEINIDVYPMREKELRERTGSSTVPQIFFNEKLIGGLVALNSLRNSGVLDKKLVELLERKCPSSAPAHPAYGFDDEQDDKDSDCGVAKEELESMVMIVKVLRKKLPIRDRFMKMKIVKNCFSGSELVDVLIHDLDCGRKKAVEIGKQLARKHYIHHVFGENEFEDGNHFYRFLEHEPFISKSYNFWGSTYDHEPKPAALLSQRLCNIMSAILESYASDDRRHLDYGSISNSEEFRRYIVLAKDLQRIDISTLAVDEKLAFFLNLYNAMVIHAVIRIGHPGGMIDRKFFFSDFIYIVGGYPYSLSTIRNGILRSNRRAPFSFIKPLGNGDRRLELAFPKVNILSHFALSNATISSPAVKFFTHQNVESELRYATREFFQRDDGLQVDLAKRTVYLTRIISWYSGDFGQEKEILKWLVNYLDATKAGLLTHLLGDGGPVNIVYQNFDWSLNT